MPTEEHILWCAHIAKRYLDMGWTSCVGAATAKPRSGRWSWKAAIIGVSMKPGQTALIVTSGISNDRTRPMMACLLAE